MRVRLLLLGVLLVCALVVSVAVGAAGLPLPVVIAVLSGSGDDTARAIIMELRMPRAVLACLVGAGLGLGGAVFQALLRNPLADPYILGVSGGAAVAAVAALTFGSVESFRSAIFWMMGNLGGATWSGSALLSLWLVPSAAVLVTLARPLNLLAVGEETAAYLGVRAERVKTAAYLVASAMVAASVAVAGVIGFVGLVVPHVVRLVWGSDHRLLLPASALGGALFLLVADTLARTVAAPAEMPVGVVTALVGVPVFVVLLARRTRA